MEHDKIWDQLKQKLPYSKSPEDVKKRAEIWAICDINSNGYCSLAELDKGVRDGINLPVLFDLKPVIMRAYQSAKTKLKATSKYGDDYVSKAQFRFFLQYLRQYYQYWIAFDRIDSNNDRRITLAEFTQAVPMMKKWGIQITDPQKSFKEVDGNKKGMILFDEFSAWAIKKNLDLDDDDNAL